MLYNSFRTIPPKQPIYRGYAQHDNTCRIQLVAMLALAGQFPYKSNIGTTRVVGRRHPNENAAKCESSNAWTCRCLGTSSRLKNARMGAALLPLFLPDTQQTNTYGRDLSKVLPIQYYYVLLMYYDLYGINCSYFLHNTNRLKRKYSLVPLMKNRQA